jgi:cytochrome oxidase Cu insertion factor (SCO1/SenC/PrrC family)
MINFLVLLLFAFLFSAINVGIEAKEYMVTENKPPGDAYSSKKIYRRLIKRMAPDFTLDSLTGDKFQLSTTRGKVVLLDFWHTY